MKVSVLVLLHDAVFNLVLYLKHWLRPKLTTTEILMIAFPDNSEWLYQKNSFMSAEYYFQMNEGLSFISKLYIVLIDTLITIIFLEHLL